MNFRFIPPPPVIPPGVLNNNNEAEYTVEGLLIGLALVLFFLGLGLFLGWLALRCVK